MLIPDPFLSSVVFIYKTENGAREDSDFQGIGFIVSIPTKTVIPKQTFKYLVTCRHILVECKWKVSLRINTGESYRLITPAQVEWIVEKTYDLAILRLAMEGSDVFSTIEENAFASRENVQKYMIGAGDDVFLIGRIQQRKIYQKKQNIPALRFGNISSPPNNEQTAYLVELRSIGGHSGSPVFAFCNGLSWPGTRKAENIFLYQFLGINRGHIEEFAEVVHFQQTPKGVKEARSGGHYAKTNVAISLTIPAYYISDVLHKPELEEDRKQQEERFTRRRKSVV